VPELSDSELSDSELSDSELSDSELSDSELSDSELSEAADLLSRFQLLGDADSGRLFELIYRAGTLTALVRAGLVRDLGVEVHRQLHAHDLLLRLLAYLPELAPLYAGRRSGPGSGELGGALPEGLSVASGETLGEVLDDVSDLLGNAQIGLAEQHLVGVLDGLCVGVLALPQEQGRLLALGLVDLVGDSPLWPAAVADAASHTPG
jgi:hypothetical protein